MGLGHWSLRRYPTLCPWWVKYTDPGIQVVSGLLTIIPSDLFGEFVPPDFATLVSTKDPGS